jgi:hypothetical protein
MVQWAFEPADETIVTAMIDKGGFCQLVNRQDQHIWPLYGENSPCWFGLR